MRVHYLPERFTHSILWSLTERLLNSSFFDGESKEVVSRLARSDWGDFSTFRNSIHYDGAFWPNSDSIGQMDLVEDNCDHSFHRAFNDNCETTVPFANDYFEKLRDLRRLIRLMLQSISEFAPQIMAELDSIEK